MMYQYFIAEWFCHRTLNFSELHSPHLWKGDGSCLQRMTVRSGDDMKWCHKTWQRVGDPEKPRVRVFSAVYTCFPHLPLRWVETLLPCCCCLMLTDVTWPEHHDGLSLHWLRVSRLASWPLVTTVRTPQAYVYAWRNWLCWGSLSCDRGRRPCSSSRPNKVASSLVVLVLNQEQILRCWLDSKQVIMCNTSVRRKQKWEQLFLIPQH